MHINLIIVVSCSHSVMLPSFNIISSSFNGDARIKIKQLKLINHDAVSLFLCVLRGLYSLNAYYYYCFWLAKLSLNASNQQIKRRTSNIKQQQPRNDKWWEMAIGLFLFNYFRLFIAQFSRTDCCHFNRHMENLSAVWCKSWK